MAPLATMTPRRTIPIAIGLAAAVLIAVGVTELPNNPSSRGARAQRLTASQTKALLAASPAVLASLHSQGSFVLEGGAPALRTRLASLKGYPIVINKWASWCVPCKAEFGAFQRASAELGRRVAFLGIDSADTSRGDAVAFLKSLPVSYPSYYDKSGQLGIEITDSSFTPVTVFIGRSGHRFIHQGPYPSLAKLEKDVQRYALDG